MADKQRYTVSLPEHVTKEIEARAKPLGSTPTEYAADVIRWWYGQGCPAVTPDEAQFQKARAFAEDAKKRILSIPTDLDIRALDQEKLYSITDDAIVQKLLQQLGIPNLFAPAAEHDEVRLMVAFDNHPTHWLVFDFFKGAKRREDNGLSFSAYPKLTTTREEMRAKLQAESFEMGVNKPFQFSQIPPKPVAHATAKHK